MATRTWAGVLGLSGAALVAPMGCGGGDGTEIPPVLDAGSGECPTITFEAPSDGAQLLPIDDVTGALCANGFFYDVVVATSAAEGTACTLFANGQKLGTGAVTSGKVTFSKVSLDANGPSSLKVQVGEGTCLQEIDVTVACNADAPSCSIKAPVISPQKVALNGVPAAEGGDRVSADGNPYQAAFEVKTDAKDGSKVALEVDGVADAATGTASGGVAILPATLVPDGEHKVKARCTDLDGFTGISAEGIYPVDTVPPVLVPAGPVAGQLISVADDVDPQADGVQFEVCGTTVSPDAIDLDPDLGKKQDNYCVSIGAASTTCLPMTSGPGGGLACVKVDCAVVGNAATDLLLTLYDAAGNYHEVTVPGVSCDTDVPSVEIVSPPAYDPGSPSPFILNTATDSSAAAGAQHPVTACTNAAVGASARLLSGPAGGGLAELLSAAVQAASPGDGCPPSKPNAVVFPAPTLPESGEGPDGALLTATRVRVDVVVNASVTATSPDVDLWVDTTVPVLFVAGALDGNNVLHACGGVIQSASDVTVSVSASATQSIPIHAVVTYADSTTSVTADQVDPGGGVTFSGVVLKPGANSIRVEGTEPAGNSGSSADCVITVGQPPTLQFVSPVSGEVFNAQSPDADPAAPGFQIDVALTTTGSADVSLEVAGVPWGSAPPSGGMVLFDNVTLPEGDAVLLDAVQPDAAGTASAKATVVVDLQAPTAAGSLASSVTDRRAAAGSITFDAPSDHDPVTLGVRAAASYSIRQLTVAGGTDCASAMTEAAFAAATPVPPGGIPAPPGTTDTRALPGLVTGRSYCVGLRAHDAAGNSGPLAAFPRLEPTWLSTTVGPPANETNFGSRVLGAIDLDGDGHDDLVATSGQPFSTVYVYYGSPSGIEPSPSVKIVGPSGSNFGVTLANLGDFNASGEAPVPLPELAIGASGLSGRGGVFVFSLPKSFHAATMTTIQLNEDGTAASGPVGASFVILADAGDANFTSSALGSRVTSIGDFDGDGVVDAAVAAPNYATNYGRVFVLRGRPAPTMQTLTLPDDSEVEVMTNLAGGNLGGALSPLGKSGLPTTGGPGGLVVGNRAAYGGAGGVFAFPGRQVGYGEHLVRDMVADATASVSGVNASFAALAGDLDGDGLDDVVAASAPPGQNPSAVALVYGGAAWGATVILQQDITPITDFLPLFLGGVLPGANATAKLGGAPTSFALFNSGRVNGAVPGGVWTIPGGPRPSSPASLQAQSISVPLPAGFNRGAGVAFAGSAAGMDAWPDLLAGDPGPQGSAPGRVVILY